MMIQDILTSKTRLIISEDATEYIVVIYKDDGRTDVYMRLPKDKYSLHEVVLLIGKM